MKTKIFVFAALALLLVPALASAGTGTLKDFVETIVTLLNQATGVLVAAALVTFLYGAAYNMIKSGERGSAALSQFLIWGIIILFVMVSIWGILNLLQNTLFGSGASGGGQTQGSGSGSNITIE